MALRSMPLRPSGYGEITVSPQRSGAAFGGTLTHINSGRVFRFRSELEFITIAERICDILQFPLTTEQYRSFTKKPLPKVAADDWSVLDMFKAGSPADSEKPTFSVKIEQRQNSTWQGTIRWLETGETRNFRSALELIRLMESAMTDENSSAV